jgi:hypothetical protein
VIRSAGVALILCLLPMAASAQTSAGPMIVEEVHNGFLVAPDFKITEIDRKTSGLAGGYAGFVIAEQFFIGGGAYVLASDRHDRDLAYGGLVLQWFGRGGERFGFSAKTLLGGGRSESWDTIQVLDRGRLINDRFRVRQDFFVAEPEVGVRIGLVSHIHLTAGAGYRFTGSARGRNGFFDGGRTGLNGAVGSIGLQIGGGS